MAVIAFYMRPRVRLLLVVVALLVVGAAAEVYGSFRGARQPTEERDAAAKAKRTFCFEGVYSPLRSTLESLERPDMASDRSRDQMLRPLVLDDDRVSRGVEYCRVNQSPVDHDALGKCRLEWLLADSSETPESREHRFACAKKFAGEAVVATKPVE